MSKVLKNTGLKILAMTLFCISIITGIVSGAIVAGMIRNNYDRVTAEEQIRKDLLASLCYNYENMAINCYDEMIMNGQSEMDHYYSNLFSEENCNFAFKIEPQSLKYPKVSNFECEDYQYSYSFYCNRLIIKDNVTFEFKLNNSGLTGNLTLYDYSEGETYHTDLEEYDIIVGEYSTTQMPEYVTETEEYFGEYSVPEDDVTEYDYGDMGIEFEDVSFDFNEAIDSYVYEDDNSDIHLVLIYDNYEVNCNLSKNKDFQKEFNNFRNHVILRNYNYYELDGYGYDFLTGTFYMGFSCGDNVSLKFSGFVKSELTARDEIYESFALRFWTEMVNVAFPMFIISCIVILITLIYIITAAGHVKGHDEIYLNSFHRIPFDIVIVGYLALILLVADIMSNSMGTYNPVITFARTMMYMPYLAAASLGEVVMVLICVVPVLVATVLMISTISARIKARGLFVNTVAWRIIKWCGKVLKRLWNIIIKQGTYLRGNIKIYWKWLGVYAIVSIIELLFCMNAQDYGFTVFLWTVEKIVIAVIVAVAAVNMQKLKKGAEIIAGGHTDYELNTENMLWEFKNHGENLNMIRDGIQLAVEDRMRSEKMKTELITNVSHDIKTPLTSIINYVDLLSKEELNNPKADEYLEVLNRQSAKLKKLIQDLIDASKASTGNMPVNLEEMDLKVLLEQITGEATEKFDEKKMKVVTRFHTDNTMVLADGKHIWRVFDNLVNNILKYGQDNTRVYIDVEGVDMVSGEANVVSRLQISIKNISREELNITGDELMERFVRGDSSRNTEGSGLGLSIARSLMDIQGGRLEIVVDGDLFKVVLLLVRA